MLLYDGKSAINWFGLGTMTYEEMMADKEKKKLFLKPSVLFEAGDGSIYSWEYLSSIASRFCIRMGDISETFNSVNEVYKGSYVDPTAKEIAVIKSDVITAQQTALAANEVATAATSLAGSANEAAGVASGAATEAALSAKSAEESATNASLSASQAQSSASSAVSTATQAKSAAEAAQKTADEALTTAQEGGNPQVMTFARMQVATLDLTEYSDDQVSEINTLLPDFIPEKHSYNIGDSFLYNGKTYRVASAHTSQAQWKPGEVGTESLYYEIEIAPDGVLVWRAPIGAHDAPNNGSRRHYPDASGPIYVSKRDGNTSVPGTDEFWELEG